MPIDWDKHVIGPTVGLFGEAATYTPKGGTPFQITGVFDREYQEVSILDDGQGSSSRKPILGVRLAKFAALPQQNDTVYVPSVDITYVVRNVKPDGHGHAVLELNARKSPGLT